MQQLPGDVDTDQPPSLSLTLAHFVVGVVVLLIGGGIAGLGPLVAAVDPAGAGSLHLLLAGWVGLTIMGAMSQFVPVWSGTDLHSPRLSLWSLWLVAIGVVALVTAFFGGAYDMLPVGATVLLAGFWTFAYNIARTLPAVTELDVTEIHFALALASLVVATTLGWVLAADLGYRILDPDWPTAPRWLLAHLTLTIFGFVLLTIVGALYQFAPRFTQSETTGVDTLLTNVELIALPAGVALLATGRLFGLDLLGVSGGPLLLVGTLAFAVFFARRLWLARVDSNPMLRRYWLVALSLVGWAVLTLPFWVANPLAFFARFGSPGATHLFFVGVITLTIVGTFYHVVPSLVWTHRYGDRPGEEAGPAVEDLYDDRIATVEFWALAVGLAILWLADLLSAPSWVLMVGGNLLGVGVLLFGANMAGVVWRHRPETGREVVLTLVGRGLP